MQLNVTTDYAIRSLLYITAHSKPVTSTEISEAMTIPQSYLIAILAKLKKAGLITSRRGNTGGYSLLKQPETVSLLEIIEVMEGEARINRCPEGEENCSCFPAADCPVRSAYRMIQRNFEESLRSVPLRSLCDSL